MYYTKTFQGILTSQQTTASNMNGHYGQREARTANSTFAIGGVSYSTDSFVVAESIELRMNICGAKPAHRKSAKRCTT